MECKTEEGENKLMAFHKTKDKAKAHEREILIGAVIGISFVVICLAAYVRYYVNSAWNDYQSEQYNSFTLCKKCSGHKNFLTRSSDGMGIMDISDPDLYLGLAFETYENSGLTRAAFCYGIVYVNDSEKRRNWNCRLFLQEELSEEMVSWVCSDCKSKILESTQFPIVLIDFETKRIYPFKIEDYSYMVNDYLIEVFWKDEKQLKFKITYLLMRPANTKEYIETFSNLLQEAYY